MGPVHTSEGVRRRSHDIQARGKLRASLAGGNQEPEDQGSDGDGDGGRLAGVFDGLTFEGDGMFDPFMGYTGMEGKGWVGKTS